MRVANFAFRKYIILEYILLENPVAYYSAPTIFTTPANANTASTFPELVIFSK